ncbi:Cyclin-dependent kinases regulatory subunit [Zancudomyces culisetae]|uniref:Cyclin-dependent kinases regulatory subunit n=1 Tax=Zancudomyces culisetae TaxID=1213189 RepID=A0A1R1PF01_ZANCU|nr:Cyclin-dependent kinases regulatory subunit [Zancudomyces culisetae]|eukprot:OMH79554.1 Cyclin-dependent kinases regulatory subunit [Zancudomyces culisetae]
MTTFQRNGRKLSYEEQKKIDIERFEGEIYYSDRYYDDEFEYRHVTLPEGLRKYLPHPIRIMAENEWRGLGIRQSPGWEHYMVHGWRDILYLHNLSFFLLTPMVSFMSCIAPEPHVLLFKREKDYQTKYPFGKS